ncbi:hypothetical protein N7449_006825 [Penicillium cf. viridicatum]|uniref:Uncharacterized protein n=1 Tax=Penicillium cf. viridicatum TaxID=2972119 RepID=A0A9W9MAX7_9EURO|nr:hypothetical protein N7449_006825 [Penicillium cf. viridicatum]
MMKQPNAISPKVVTPTVIQEDDAEIPVLVYDFQMPEFRSAVKDWGPLWYCGSQGTGGFMSSSHGSNTESGLDNGLWIPPPNGTNLTDEEVYIATKYLPSTERVSRWPVDFDRNGHIRAARSESSLVHLLKTPGYTI